MSAGELRDSARAWLDERIFPDAPARPGPTPRVVLIAAGIAVASVVIQLARLWSSKPVTTVWAEDGYIYLADAMKWSVLHAVTTPYNGYLQVLPRLVAAFVVLLPLSWYAAAMSITGALIVTASAFVVWCASAGHIANTYLRGALVAMMLLLPIVGVESPDNVTNSIWYLLFASFWILLWRPATSSGAVVAGVFLLVAALSNGGILILLPLWALRLLVVRSRRDVVIVVAFAVGVAVQLSLSWKYLGLIGEPGSPLAKSPGEWHWDLVPAYLQRIVGGVLTGQRIGAYLWVQLGTLFVVALAACLVALLVMAMAGGTKRTRVIVPLMVSLSMVTFLFAGYQRWQSAGRVFYWSGGTSSGGSHYFIVPALLLLSALLVQLDARPTVVSPVVWQRLRIGGVGFVLVAALLTFNVSSSVRGSPTWSRAVAAGRTSCLNSELVSTPVIISSSPYIQIPMQIPCSRLIGSKLTAGRRPPPPDPHTTIAKPTNGATLSGAVLVGAAATDTVLVTKVEIRLSGPTGLNKLLGTAQFSLYGYTLYWNTRTVPNGTYVLQSVVYDTAGHSARSPGVFVVVKNVGRNT